VQKTAGSRPGRWRDPSGHNPVVLVAAAEAASLAAVVVAGAYAVCYTTEWIGDKQTTDYLSKDTKAEREQRDKDRFNKDREKSKEERERLHKEVS
jgi:hypothetical protein